MEHLYVINAMRNINKINERGQLIMYGIKSAKKFDGVYAIVSESEYNKISTILKRVAEEYKDIRSEAERTLEVLKKYSYFDREKRECRIQLAYRELSLITEVMYQNVSILEVENAFEARLNETDCRIWKDE